MLSHVDSIMAEGIQLPRTIRKLEEAVVNRIAAGEVIQRPANALKEMVENSLDAGSTSIQVTVKNGGLKLLQIQDNGSGIKKEDMEIVCERFTTSKLEKFEDLTNINTYGFRGEALASISHVAHVTITTRTADSKCAYKGSYCDGKLLSPRAGGPPEVKLCAGNQGTQITAEDLFYNVPTRRNALRSPSDEYHKIADMMGKYSIHNSGVAFILKKLGNSVADIRTTTSNSTEDNIGLIYGQSVVRELLPVSSEDNKLGFKMNGFVTNANYSVKKFIFLLFINHRLVDSSSLRKAIETVYATYLPKNTHPFIYMSIEIAPNNIDVNVHPTKHEVHFLHEDLITQTVQRCIEERLLGCNSSRTYYTQALLPGVSVPVSLEGEESERGSVATDRVYAHQMVRTDSREQKLDAFMIPTLSVKRPTSDSECVQEETTVQEEGLVCEGGDSDVRKRKQPLYSSPAQRRKKHHTPVHLTSVKNLLKSLSQNQHRELTSLFAEHKFVGCVDQTKALVQHQTKLYLVDLTKITQELFYQLVLLDFANFDVMKLNPSASIFDLAMVGLDCPESGWTSEDGSKESLAHYLVNFLKSKGDMLKDYFSFEINKDGQIISLPLLLEGYTPNIDNLPVFLLRLVTEVNWEDEQKCFDTFARECGRFYCIQHDPFLSDSNSIDNRKDEIDPALMKQLPWQWIIEHIIFPSLRCDFIPSCSMADDGSVLQISDLKDLYKVFERC